MKLGLYVALLLLVCFLPVHPTDVGKLIPVEVIVVSETDGMVAVRTDTGNQGQGDTLRDAFADLQDTAPGTIYLDTAEYLLLEQGAAYDVADLQTYLKANTKVCAAQPGILVDGIAEYLSVHDPGVRLKHVADVPDIPVLTEKDGIYRIQ